MIDSLVKTFFFCSHRKLSFPITVKHDPRVPGSPYGTRTYMICLDCGTELRYSWDEMRIERAERSIISSLVRQFASWLEFVRAAFNKGVKFGYPMQDHEGWSERGADLADSNGAVFEDQLHPASPKCATMSAKIRATLAGIFSPEPSSVTPRYSQYRSHRRPLTRKCPIARP